MEQSFHVPGICRSCNLRIPGRGNRTILIWCISDIYKLGRRIQQQTFVGLKNYAAVVADSSFWQSLGLTLLYVVVSVILVNVIGFYWRCW